MYICWIRCMKCVVYLSDILKCTLYTVTIECTLHNIIVILTYVLYKNVRRTMYVVNVCHVLRTLYVVYCP